MSLKNILASVLLAIFVQGTALAAPIPLRGVVEGFYGKPWTQAQRADMLAFCEAHGLNAYIYAPKDDPYHREKWREPYPKSKMKKLAALIREAQTRQVKFIFAVSPGLDFSYAPLHGAEDREKLLEKLEAVYAVGARDFAIFFDDIKEKDGNGQAELLRWLDEHFVAAHGDVSPLITVPTEYFLADMREAGGAAKPYTKAFSKGLPKTAVPLFTGDGVAMGTLTKEILDRAAALYGRRLGLWWNYPVNDYMEAKLALGPVEGLPKDAEIPAVFFNPMAVPETSKIALATGAACALAPESYDPQTEWEIALREQYGGLAPEMELFADQSQRLENNWAHIGRNDGAALRAEMDDFWRAWQSGEDVAGHAASLRQKFDALQDAAELLRRKLPKEKLRECKRQLKQLGRLAEADSLALDLLEAKRQGDEKRTKKLAKKLRKKWENIANKEKEARLSEATCRAFVEEALRHAGEEPAARS